jgi:hypothetical protein
MAASPRPLAYKDRFVYELEEAVATRFATFDNLSDRYIFPDLTTQVNFVLSLNQVEWTQLYSAVLTGADLTYPDQNHNVEYLFLQMMDVTMADLCAVIAGCIENSSATRDALSEFLQDGGYGSGGGDGDAPTVYDENDLVIDGSQFPGCDNDQLFGAITQTVDLFNQVIEDAFEAFEASTAPWERVSAILEAIPITNILAVDDLIQFADQMFENLSQNYLAEYTAAIRDEYRCDLFCITKDTCEMRFQTMADYFLSRVGESITAASWVDWIDWFVFGSFPDEAVVHASHAILCSVLAYGSKFFNLDNTWLARAMTSFLNDPDSDWSTLCTCVEPALLVGIEPTIATEDAGGWWDLTDPLFVEEAAPNGQWYYRAYVYSSDINTCAQFLELDMQGITRCPTGNRAKYECGVPEVIHGLGYGVGQCIWRIEIRCYADTGIRVRMGADC